MEVINWFNQIKDDKRYVDEIKDVSVRDAVFDNTDQIFTIIPGVKGGQQVASLKAPEYITKKEQGCDNVTFTSFKDTLRGHTQFWNPKRVEISLSACYKEFEGSFLQWALGNGLDVRDLTKGDLASFITSYLTSGMKADFARIAFHADENIGTQNILTKPALSEHYDQIDKGLVSTLLYLKTIPEFKDNFIEIAKNNDADQFNLNEDYAIKIYEELVDDADFDANMIFTSNSLRKNYRNYFKYNKNLDSGNTVIQKGFGDGEYDGIGLKYAKESYDKKRKLDFKRSKIHIPHLAIYTNKENLQIGVDDTSALEDIRLHAGTGKDRNIYIEGTYMIDFKVADLYDIRAAL